MTNFNITILLPDEIDAQTFLEILDKKGIKLTWVTPATEDDDPCIYLFEGLKGLKRLDKIK